MTTTEIIANIKQERYTNILNEFQKRHPQQPISDVEFAKYNTTKEQLIRKLTSDFIANPYQDRQTYVGISILNIRRHLLAIDALCQNHEYLKAYDYFMKQNYLKQYAINRTTKMFDIHYAIQRSLKEVLNHSGLVSIFNWLTAMKNEQQKKLYIEYKENGMYHHALMIAQLIYGKESPEVASVKPSWIND